MTHIRPLGAAQSRAVLAEQLDSDARVLAEAADYELVMFTASEPQMDLLREVASDLEAHGEAPYVRWSRDESGTIVGLSLWARLSSETLAGMKDVPVQAMVGRHLETLEQRIGAR